MEPQQNEIESVMAPLKKVTPLSKYLAMLLFVLLPFVGGYVGYQLASVNMIKAEKESSSMEPANSREVNVVKVQNDDEIKLDEHQSETFTEVSVAVDEQQHTLQFAIMPQVTLSIAYPPGWQVDDFKNQVTKGNGYETLVRVNNPSTPGVSDTDAPREYIHAAFVSRSCEGSVVVESRGLRVYDTGWIENGFIEGVSTRTVCIPADNKFLLLTFNPLFSETQKQMDISITEMLTNY